MINLEKTKTAAPKENISYTRVNNDYYKNPRYVVSFLNFLNEDELNSDLSVKTKYTIALARSREIGGKKYRAKSYGGGIVFQSHNIDADLERIRELVAQSVMAD